MQVENKAPLKVYCDNQAALCIAQNLVHHDRTKHVEIDRHFIKEKIDKGIVELSYMPSSKQVADVLTKGLPRQNFEALVDKLGMINIYSLA